MVVPVDVGGSIAKGLQVNQLRQQLEAHKAAVQEKNAMRSLYSERFGGLDPQTGITWNTGRQQAVTNAGRPLYTDAASGERYSEKSMTTQLPDGSWVNFPTVDRTGRILPEGEAFRMVQQAGMRDPQTGRQLETFGTMDDAVSSAQSRSAGLTGQTRPMMSDDEFVGRAMAIDPQAGISWQQYYSQKSAAELERDKAEAPLVVAALEGVQDQAGYDRARLFLSQRGVDVSDVPPEYSRGTVNMVLQGARYLGDIKPQEGPKAPEGFRWTAAGGLEPIPGYVEGKATLAEATRSPRDTPSAGEGGPFGGTALDAQAMNILLAPNANTSSPAYIAAYNHLAQPRVSFDPQTGRQITTRPDMSAYRQPVGRGGEGGGGEFSFGLGGGQAAPQPAPGGGVPVQQSAAQGPGAGVTTENVTPPRLSIAEAQAVGSLQGVSRELASVEGLFFPNGQYDRDVAISAGDYGIVRGVPFTQGRTARQSMRRAIEVILRTRTGAAAPDSEVDSYMEQFFPSPADTDEQAKAKFQAAKNFVNDTYQMFGGTRDLPSLTQPQQQGTQPAQGGRTPPPPGFVPF
jgi:hypothetical protein